jgi:pimeloyl-ACP methyl ester carboxylesterase
MKMNYKNLALIFFFLIIVTFSYGFSVSQYQIFPYDLAKEFKQIVIPDISFNEKLYLDEYIYEINPSDLIKINNESDVLEKRNLLNNYIWNTEIFPYTKQPTKIDKNISDEKLDNLKNLKSIDKITIEMKHNVNSISYLLIPENSNNELIIYQHGHNGDFRQNDRVLEFFLEKEYAVLAFSMPLIGMNNQPNVDLPDYGSIKLINHNRFNFLENKDFHPIKYFVEPITLSLNYVDNSFSFDSYNFVGISGGGWTAIIYSAIDDRISKTFSVAGSLPLYLRVDDKNAGDYEQEISSFYSLANYLELYLLGAYGEDRQLVQIFNKNDPCCFSGEISSLYYNSVTNVLQHLGSGSFEILIDENYSHSISDNTLKKIHEYISK